MSWASSGENADNAYDGGGNSARGDLIWNILTVLVLMGILVLLGAMAFIFANPSTAINPFPPPTLPASVVLPTATSTPNVMPATWTVTPTRTLTPIPTLTPPPAVVGTDAVEITPGAALETVDATEQPGSRYAFALQGEVKAIDASIFRQEHGCKWMGVAGQTFDIQGRPATGITVQMGGTLGRNYIDLISLTGTALWYGQAGYEVFLSDTPTETKNSLWVRLLDQSGLPLSAKIYFSTSADCTSNLVVINFKQVR